MTQPSVIVHLGAGRGRELDEYLAAKPERIVLVEADPVAARSLARRAASLPQVEVIAKAVAATGGKAALKIFNLSAVNSLRSPTGLRVLFPGLRLRKEIEVEALSPRELVDVVGLAADRGNWLVIDVPGEEAAVIEALRQTEQLDLFAKITLNCGKLPLYEGGQDAVTLLQILDGEGYEVLRCDNDTDPDRPSWVLRKNQLKVKNLELLSQISQLTKARDEQSRHLSELKTQLDQASKARDEQAKLAVERQAKIDELSKARDEQSRHLSELKTQLDQASKAKDEQAKLAVERQARIKELEASLADFESRQALLAEEMARAEGQLDVIKEILLHETAPQ